MFLVSGQKYLKTKKEFIFVSIKNNLMKFIKELVFYQKKFVSAMDVKKKMLLKIYLKTNRYGFELKHIN